MLPCDSFVVLVAVSPFGTASSDLQIEGGREAGAAQGLWESERGT
jgi:hypothetical protein